MNLIRLHSRVVPFPKLARVESPKTDSELALAPVTPAAPVEVTAGGSTQAYPVPWRVTAREPDRSVTLHNAGGERLSFVRFAVAGTGSLALTLPRHVAPGQTCFVELREPYGAPDTLITVRWFRPDRSEYLWVLSL